MDQPPWEILLVEDNPITRAVTRKYLEKSGFIVREAEDGQQAIEQFSGKRPDLLLVDLLLPDMHGIDLIRRLKAIPGGLGGVPALACSGSFTDLSMNQLLDAGFKGFLEKPIEPAQFIQQIRSHLQPDGASLMDGGGRVVLVIGVGEVQRVLLEKRLTARHFRMIFARNQWDALEILRETENFAVFMELRIPGQDSFDLAMAIHNLRPFVPVFLLSEHLPERGDRQLALQFGVRDLLSKTPDLRAIDVALSQLLSREAEPSFSATETPSRTERDLGRLLNKMEGLFSLNSTLSRRNTRLIAQRDILATLSESILHQQETVIVLRDILTITTNTEGFALGGILVPEHLVAPGIFCSGLLEETLIRAVESLRPLPLLDPTRSLLLNRDGNPNHAIWEVLQQPSIQSVLVVSLLSCPEGRGYLLIASEMDLTLHTESALFVRGVASQIDLALALRQSMNEEQARLHQARAQRQEAQEQALLLSTILDGLSEGVITFNRRTQQQHWNKAAQRLLGEKPAGDWRGIWDVFLEDGVTPIPPEEEPMTQVLQGNPQVDRVLFFRRKDGSRALWLEVTARRLETEDEGLLGGVLLFQDLTEQRISAEKIRANKASWKALVEQAPDLILHIDLAGVIQSSNRNAWGIPRDALAGHRIDAVLPPGSRALWQQSFLDAVQHAEPRSCELVFDITDNQECWGSLKIGPILEADRCLGFILVIRDVTEKKRSDEQEFFSERMASVGILAAGVAHEINNPLTAISTNIELTRASLKGLSLSQAGDIREMLDDAFYASERVRQIVRDLKIFARSEEERYGPVNIQEVLETTIRLAWNEIRHRARLVRDFAPVSSVHGNESRLGQVFLNLLVNAVQAIPAIGQAEQHEILIRLHQSEHGVEVSIHDTGEGISPAVIRRLYTPFFTTKPVGVGTGLGLAVCHRIVSDHKGDIRIESAPGQGTTVTVVLPLSAAPVAPVKTSIPPVPSTRKRILVIDDEPVITTAIRRILGKTHDITTTQEAQEALSWLAGGQTFDLILCDLMMPQMSGMDFYEELRRVYPQHADRTRFLTGGAFTAKSREFLASMQGRYLEKPFQSKVLLGFVNDPLPSA